MRAIAGIISGLIAGFIATVLIGILGLSTVFSVPAGMDPANPQHVIRALANMPLAPMLALAAAWFTGGLVGAIVAKLVARRNWVAWAVAALIALYVVLNLGYLTLPAGMQALWVIAPLLGGLIANLVVKSGIVVASAQEDAVAPVGDA